MVESTPKMDRGGYSYHIESAGSIRGYVHKFAHLIHDQKLEYHSLIIEIIEQVIQM